ncbi:MAG: FkbM family methyltransferase [Devosia sp.]
MHRVFGYLGCTAPKKSWLIKARESADILKDAEFNLGGWSIKPTKDGDWELPMVPLDQYVRDRAIAKVHLLRVDVEGFELKVLQGGDTLLRKLHPYVIVEMRAGNERDRVRCEKMTEQLETRDYINCRIMKRPFPHVRALEPTDTASGKYHFNMLALPAARYREFEASFRG